MRKVSAWQGFVCAGKVQPRKIKIRSLLMAPGMGSLMGPSPTVLCQPSQLFIVVAMMSNVKHYCPGDNSVRDRYMSSDSLIDVSLLTGVYLKFH